MGTALKFKKRKTNSSSRVYVLLKTCNEALSRRNRAVTAKKYILKKCDGHVELFFCLSEPIAFLTFSSPSPLLKLPNRDFKIQRRGRQRERQKNKRFNKQNKALHVHHAVLYISVLFLHDFDVKMPIIT